MGVNSDNQIPLPNQNFTPQTKDSEKPKSGKTNEPIQLGHELKADKSKLEKTKVQREKIQPAEHSDIKVEEFVQNVVPKKLSIGLTLKNEAAKTLFEGKNINPGREKLLNTIIKDPGLLERDLNRLGVLSIGNRSDASYSVNPKTGNVLTGSDAHKLISDALSAYIKNQNSNLKVNSAKMGEILYSASQYSCNNLLETRADVLPQSPWESTKSKQETTFKFESDSWFNDPEVLVVTKKITKSYINIDDDNAKPKDVVVEAQIKHNLTTGEVTFNYKLSMDGKVEEWDPTKRFTDGIKLQPLVENSPAENFRRTIGEGRYQDLKKEISVVNAVVLKHMDALKQRAGKDDIGSVHYKINPKDAATTHIYSQITANGKYGLIVTKSGGVFIDIPSTVFAQGGEKKISFAVQLFAGAKPLTKTSEKSTFAPTILADVESSQVAIFGESLGLVASNELTGDTKVLNSKIKNFDNILKPHVVTQFKIGEEDKQGILMPYCDGGDLKSKLFDLKKEDEFNTYKNYAIGMLSGINEFHQAGMFHRDIKPENFMIQNGTVKLSDFGTVLGSEEIKYKPVNYAENDFNAIRNTLMRNEKKCNLSLESEANYKLLMDKLDGLETETKGKFAFKILTPDLLVTLEAYKNSLQGLEADQEGKKALSSQIAQINRLITKIDSPIGKIRELGTPAYNPPEMSTSAMVSEFERANPEMAAASRDLYSVGLSLYELSHQALTGTGDEISAFKTKYANSLPESENDRIILGLLNSDPSQRGTASAVLENLKNLQFVNGSAS